MTTKELTERIENVNARSAWDKGVKWYALYLIAELEDSTKVVPPRSEIEAAMLNGARDWRQYSDGGCALVCNMEIARLLCSPSELRKSTRRDGSISDKANCVETWLDVQARALYQACRLIKSVMSD